MRRLGGAIGIVAIIALWWIVAVVFFGDNGAVPTPWAVLRQYNVDGLDFYWANASVTVRSAAIGYLWGNGLALAVALVVLLVPFTEGIATQLAVISYCLPMTAIGPIVLIVFGGRAPTIFLAAVSVFFTTLIGALLGLRAADRASLDLVTAYGGNRWHRLVKVQVIAAVPSTLNALKIAVPGALLGAIIGEYLGGVDSGLGVAMTVAQEHLLVARTWALALLCGAIAGAGYLVLALVGRFVTPWSTSQSAPGVRRLLTPLVTASVVVVVLWAGFLRAFDVNRLVGQPPSAVWDYLLRGPEAAAHRAAVSDPLWITLRDAGLGFAGGLVAAVVIAVLFVLVRSVEHALMPVAMLLRSVPLVAMTPLIVLVFGRDLAGVAVIGGIVVFFPALVNMVFGLRSAPVQTVDLVTAYGGSKWTVLRKVALPTSLPAFFASARIAVPAALVGALIAEWLATGQGTGGAIVRAIGGFRYDELWASVVVLTATSIVLYTVVGLIEAAVLARFTHRPG